MKRIHDKIKNTEQYHIAMLMHVRSGKRVEVDKLYEMVEHVKQCRFKDCQKVYAEESMTFIGNEKMELSECEKAQSYLTFY